MRYIRKGKGETKLAVFIYQLMQSGVALRKIEKAIDFAEVALSDKKRGCILANGWSAGAAQEIAEKIMAPAAAARTSDPAGVAAPGPGAVVVKKLGRHFKNCECWKCVARRKKAA